MSRKRVSKDNVTGVGASTTPRSRNCPSTRSRTALDDLVHAMKDAEFSEKLETYDVWGGAGVLH
jgi:hypothetical protein